jgi:hypothetical protein
MAKNQYLIVKTKPCEGACRLRTIKHVPNDHRFSIGASFRENFPADALFKMNDSFPNDVRLVDSLHNLSALLVVSERFKNALEAIPGALVQNEVLPVAIVNHRGRKEKAPYFIIHQLAQPACLDEAKTKGTRSRIAPAQFQFLKKMVLDPERIPTDLMLFRAAQYPQLPLVRSDLAESLAKLDLVGVELCDIASYAF